MKKWKNEKMKKWKNEKMEKPIKALESPTPEENIKLLTLKQTTAVDPSTQFFSFECWSISASIFLKVWINKAGISFDKFDLFNSFFPSISAKRCFAKLSLR